jgi:hypothetical protein
MSAKKGRGLHVKLDSARALKEMIVTNDAAARAFGSTLSPPPEVAVGIAVRKPGSYGIAVRMVEATPAGSQFVKYAREAAFDEIDVRVTGSIHPQVRERTLERGCSVGHATGGGGTLGGFVRCRRTGAIGVVSNNHVLANENAAERGDLIIQPSRFDGGTAPADVVGTLDRFVPLRTDARNRVDAAFAVLSSDISLDARDPVITRIAEPEEDLVVHKVGAATGWTEGWITAFELDGVAVLYPQLGTVTFDGVVEVQGGGAAFSSPGDSGSLIVSDSDGGVALLFAGTQSDDPLTYGNLLAEVLTELDIELLTRGSTG